MIDRRKAENPVFGLRRLIAVLGLLALFVPGRALALSPTALLAACEFPYRAASAAALPG